MWSAWGVSAGVAEAVEEALGVLAGLGMEIVDLPLPELELALPACLAISLSEAVFHHRRRLAASPRLYLPGTRVMIETGALVTGEDVVLAREATRYLRSFIASAMKRAGVTALVSPTLPVIAPLTSSMTTELTAEAKEESLSSALRMLATANLTGMPAVSVPCGVAAGQPVGLHIMGPQFSDAKVLAIACSYQDAMPWRDEVPVHTLPELAGMKEPQAGSVRIYIRVFKN